MFLTGRLRLVQWNATAAYYTLKDPKFSSVWLSHSYGFVHASSLQVQNTECESLCMKGTPEKLIEQLKLDSDGVDTYVEDFLLTYRTFVKTTCDITTRFVDWCSDYKLRDKVCSHSFTFATELLTSQ